MGAIAQQSVRLLDVNTEVGNLEQQLEQLQQLSGQKSVLEFIQKKISELLKETGDIEQTVEKLPSERQTDKQNLLAEITRARTSLIKLEGEASHKSNDLEIFMKQRKRRV